MHKAKGTTSNALRIHMHQEGGNIDHHEASFRVLYYGDASAGSVPFMWESHPGTPKHALTESSLPPLTPPPSFQNNQFCYNRNSSKRSGFLRTVFLGSYRKTTSAPVTASFSSCSISSSSSSSSSSHLNSSQSSTPTRKTTEVWRRRSPVKFGLVEDYDGGCGGSPTSTLCFGGGIRKGYRVKKVKTAILSFVRHGRA